MAHEISTRDELLAEIQFWIGMYGKALDTLDEIAADDDVFELDRQKHAEVNSARLRSEHQRWTDPARNRLRLRSTPSPALRSGGDAE